MTKGQRQEIGSRWLEETMLDKEATAPEAISDGSEGNEKELTPPGQPGSLS